MASESATRKRRWFRFLVGGGANTVFTYALYFALNTVLAYQLAYFIAYSLGVVFAYWFNAVVVFQVPLSWRGLFSYPAVYVVQYFTSAFMLGGLVELAGIEESLAPLVVAIVMVPVTYVMSKNVLEWVKRPRSIVGTCEEKEGKEET